MSRGRVNNQFYRKLRLDKTLRGAIKCFMQLKYYMLKENEERKRYEKEED